MWYDQTVQEAYKDVDLVRLASHLQKVQARIQAACRRSGRDPDSVRLLTVTKSVPSGWIKALTGLGVTRFGESRIGDALPRIAQFPDCEWHFIGHLQKNKVGKAVGRFRLIHSVDSMSLAEAVNRRSGEAGFIQDLLYQVNVSGETSKHGFAPEAVAEAVRSAQGLTSIRVCGLMTMAPLEATAAECTGYFKALAEIAADVSKSQGVALPELSMGMSNDFEQAVECGATLLRIGSALFEGCG